MRTPIIIFEDLDAEAYETVRDAENALEPIDVRNGEYKAYDSRGKPLQLNIVSRDVTNDQFWKRLLFGPSIRIERVAITEDDQQPIQNEHLTHRLREYLRWSGAFSGKASISDRDLQDMPLDHLVAMVPASKRLSQVGPTMPDANEG